MNKIIENFLDIHKKEYSIERLDTEKLLSILLISA